MRAESILEGKASDLEIIRITTELPFNNSDNFSTCIPVIVLQGLR
jgi:hypothetical protein